ncbi:MAG: hypothetical protein ABI665_14165 [Vicinamibacterales bacterium]
MAPVAFAGQTAAPAAPAAPKKLISPQRGEATVEITKPDTKVKGTDVVTVIMVKNTSASPIAGFKVEENWYDAGNTAIGGDVFRYTKPFMPGDVITVTLETPKTPKMKTNQYQFSHANGTIKPKSVPKLTPTT